MKYLLSFLLVLLCGCIPKPPQFYTPSSVMREIESQKEHWILLNERGENFPSAIAYRLHTRDTLILLDRVFYMISSYTTRHTIIEKSSVPKEFATIVTCPSISVEETPDGREYVEKESGKAIMSYGAFINIDKIFFDNKWCKTIFIDDLHEGYFFKRNNGESDFAKITSGEYWSLLKLNIFLDSDRYLSWKKDLSK